MRTRIWSLVLFSSAAAGVGACRTLEFDTLERTDGDQRRISDEMQSYVKGGLIGEGGRLAVFFVACADPRWERYRSVVFEDFSRSLARVESFEVEQDGFALEAFRARHLPRHPEREDLLTAAAGYGLDYLIEATLRDVWVRQSEVEGSHYLTGLTETHRLFEGSVQLEYHLIEVAQRRVVMSGRDEKLARVRAQPRQVITLDDVVRQALRMTIESHVLAIRTRFGPRPYIEEMRGDRAAARVRMPANADLKPGARLAVYELGLEPDFVSGRLREFRQPRGELEVITVSADHCWAIPTTRDTREALRLGFIVEVQRGERSPLEQLGDFFLRGRSY